MTAPRIVIQPATAADLEALTGIVTADPHSSWTRQSLEAELKTAWSHVELAREEGVGILGFMVWWHSAGEVELLEIATHPSHRRRGVGRALMQHLLAQARRLGVARVMLEVRRSNLAATRLYEAFGFVVVGVRPRYYAGGEDAILMDWRDDAGQR